MICSIGKPPLYISSLERYPLDSTLVFIVFTKRVGKCSVHKLSSLFSIPPLVPGINLYHYSKIPPERLNCSTIFFFGFILFHHACSIFKIDKQLLPPWKNYLLPLLYVLLSPTLLHTSPFLLEKRLQVMGKWLVPLYLWLLKEGWENEILKMSWYFCLQNQEIQ